MEIMDLIPPEQWRQIPSVTIPADSTFTDLYPHELVGYHLWWDGLSWLLQPLSDWPATPALADRTEPSEEKASAEGLGFISLAIMIDLPLLD